MMNGRVFSNGCDFGKYGVNGHYARFGAMHSGMGILFMVGIIVLIAIVVFLLTHRNNKKHNSNNYKSGNTNAVLETLKMKFVQGEITEEEYLKRKEVLLKD